MPFWQSMERFPPILVRLLARHRYGAARTTAEIAHFSGLSPAEVEAISQCTNWSGVTVANARSFMHGCGIDLCNTRHVRRAEAYLRQSPTFLYLRNHKQYREYYAPMLLRWAESPEAARVALVWKPVANIISRIKRIKTSHERIANTAGDRAGREHQGQAQG